MDLSFYQDILNINSTSGQERALAEVLTTRLKTSKNVVTTMEVGDGTLNLLVSWGTPKLLFCTHMDTVPPYIAPSVVELDGDTNFLGRGTCDAKGQLFSMWEACKALEADGQTDFGLLLLSGEETGSYGAKAFRKAHTGAQYVIVGEPTDNKMVSASKGTKSFRLTFHGRPCHSGYPELGESAVMNFHAFLSALQVADLPIDPLMGQTTWNVGELSSPNKQNILSPECVCRLYFRTTAASDAMIADLVNDLAKLHNATVEAFGGDTPMSYLTFSEFPTQTVAFGSDAPQLTNCPIRMLYGPGSIFVAHKPEEHLLLSDIQQAVDNYIRIYHLIQKL